MDEHEKHLKIIAGGAAIVFIGVIFSYVFGYLTRVVIARYLGAESYGLISLALAIFGFFTTFALVGLPISIPKFLSHDENASEIKGTILSALKISIPLSIFFAAILFLFAPQIATLFNKPELAPLLKIFSLVVPFYALQDICISTFQGFKKPKYKFYIQDFAYGVVKFGLVVLFIALGTGVVGASIGWALSFVFIAPIVAIILQKKVFPILNTEIKSKNKMKKLFSFSYPLLFSGFLTVVIAWADVLLLGFFKNSETVGLYSAALPTAITLTFLSSAFAYLFMPVVSELHYKKEFNQVKILYKAVTRWIFILTFPVFLAFILYPNLIMEILFGTEYIVAANALRIISIGYFIAAATSPSFQALISFGKSKQSFLVSLVIALTNVALNLYLIPRYSMIGAAVAMTGSLIFGAIAGIWLTYGSIKNPFSRNLIKPILAGIIAAVIFLYIPSRFAINSWQAIIFGIFFLMFYLFLILIFKTIKHEDFFVLKYIEAKTGLKASWLRNFVKRFI